MALYTLTFGAFRRVLRLELLCQSPGAAAITATVHLPAGAAPEATAGSAEGNDGTAWQVTPVYDRADRRVLIEATVEDITGNIALSASLDGQPGAAFGAAGTPLELWLVGDAYQQWREPAAPEPTVPDAPAWPQVSPEAPQEGG